VWPKLGIKFGEPESRLDVRIPNHEDGDDSCKNRDHIDGELMCDRERRLKLVVLIERSH
jgi:hypothetical protein